ncbi:MAG TPA: hypothetical protein VGK30_16955 [Candidatus Binatia bacterium]|jgi:hypothetical protein
MNDVLSWLTPVLDVAVMGMVAVLLWRLRRDPLATWQAHEQRLQSLLESFRLLAAQSEGVARDLDGALGQREERLRTLAAETAASTRAAQASAPAATRADAARGPAHADVVARVRRLAAEALPLEEIARRVDMPTAEVRVLVGLYAEQRRAGAPAAETK